jgi:8-oxo-dGTP pyrophosphatase MutT (NUDIX family)
MWHRARQTLLYFGHAVYQTMMQWFARLVGKRSLGVRAIVVDAANKVLLVKHTYHPGWYLPGGGIKRRETPEAAIIREVHEEAGIQVVNKPTLWGIYLCRGQIVEGFSIVYLINDFTCFTQSSLEIEAMGWFEFNQLPEGTTLATKTRLAEFFTGTPQSSLW